MDYTDKKVLIGLSGGINSMAVLCWLADYEFKPKELHLFYAHFEEHSPDTLDFVLAGVEFAKKNFEQVHYKQTNNSILAYFGRKKMIPHPMYAPCTSDLKIIPMIKYSSGQGIQVDLIGYVKSEMRRVKNMQSKGASNLFLSKEFPIIGQTNEWCFEITKEKIGWYPKIYDIRNEKGERIFTHNNCLPCKNMQIADFKQVQEHYPEYWQKAMDLANEIQKHWGRSADSFSEAFNVTFGREDWETGFKKQSCDTCAFD